MAGRVEDVLHYIAKESAWLDVGHVMKGVTKDPGDDAFATLAIEAGVNYLVTLDNDFGPLGEAGYTVRVVRPGDFLHLLRLAS